MVKANPPKVSELVLDDSNNFHRSWSQFFDNIARRIGGDKAYSLGGRLTTSTTEVGNIGTGEDNLITYTLSQNTLENTGDVLEIISFGAFAANANNKQVKQYLGTTQLFATGAVASNAKDWVIKSTIIRTAAATQTVISEFNGDTVTVTQTADFVTGTEDFTTDLTIKCTGEATTTDDIIQKGLIINIYPVR